MLWGSSHEQRSAPRVAEEGGDPLSDSIVMEIRNSEKALGDTHNLSRQNGQFEFIAEFHGGELVSTTTLNSLGRKNGSALAIDG